MSRLERELAAAADGERELAELRAVWPWYAIDFNTRNWAATDGAVLLVAGSAESLAGLMAAHRERILSQPQPAGLTGDIVPAAP